MDPKVLRRRKPRRAILISLCVVVVGGLALLWVVASASPRVFMRVLELNVRQWPDDIAEIRGSREYVVATIELTNATSRPITYWARGDARFVDSTILHDTPAGWKEPSQGWKCGTGMGLFTLAPSKAVTFEAMMERDKRCKVAVHYSDGRKPSPFWERLPDWLTQRLPWARSSSTVSTEAIDARDVRGLTKN